MIEVLKDGTLLKDGKLFNPNSVTYDGKPINEMVFNYNGKSINVWNDNAVTSVSSNGNVTIDYNYVADKVVNKLVDSDKFELTEKYKKQLEAKAHQLKMAKDIARFNSMFKNAKVIINEPAVILFIDGKKIVSKASDEEFDAEKGLMMCLLKWKGLTNIDIQKLLKRNTVDVTKK